MDPVLPRWRDQRQDALRQLAPWLDDGLRYQLAYACYATGRVESLERLAAAIDDPWLAEGVTELIAASERP